MPRRVHTTWALAALALSCAACQESAAAATSSASAIELPPTAAADCGHAGTPDCPLQNWMKATVQAYQRAADYARLGRAFDDLSEHAPTGFDGWQALAKRGARAALDKDDAALRQVCKDCHNQHRARYRRELRNQPLWQ